MERDSDRDVDVEVLQALEAILIVADEPVTDEAAAAALGIDVAGARRACEALAAEYSGATASAGGARARGFVLREGAGGWRLASAPRFTQVVEDFVIGGATARLSQAALETLAVIAYRQPITRGRIAAVRGVNVDGVVRTLHARGLIEEAGTEASGAVAYRTTDVFLDYLGLRSLDELAPLAPLLPQAGQLGDVEEEARERAQRAAARQAARTAQAQEESV